MDVYKEQATGLFICKLCNKDYNSLGEAMECASTHKKAEDSAPLTVPAHPIDNDSINEYRDMKDREGISKLAEKLCMSLIEDYVVSRQRDMMDKGKVSAMTLSLGKVAAEALINLNKAINPTKNLNVNVDANRATDVEALRKMMDKTKDKVIEDVEDED